MLFLFAGEAVAEAAAGIFAVVLGVIVGVGVNIGTAETDFAEAFGAAEGFVLEA